MLPADMWVDLRCCCPWLSAADRSWRVVRGPSAARIALRPERKTSLAPGPSQVRQEPSRWQAFIGVFCQL